MNGEIPVGIHHLALFPDCWQIPAVHERSLLQVLEWPEFYGVDTCCWGTPAAQQHQARWMLESSKRINYLLPVPGMVPGCNPGAAQPVVAKFTRDHMLQHLDLAAAAGCDLVVVTSGRKPADLQRAAALHAWQDYLAWLGEQAKTRQLRLVVEPHDQNLHHSLLIGPMAEARRSVEAVQQRGLRNVGLMVDMAHQALLCEPFQHAIKLAAPYLWHAHISNTIMRDTNDELFGDYHPPLGIAGGEFGVPELVLFLRQLQAAEYFDNPAATLTLEMRPYPLLSARQSARCGLDMLEEACAALETE